MTQDYKHPIAPPSELVEQWYDAIDNQSTAWKQQLATRAAQWGANQELDACCEWMAAHSYFSASIRIREDRRPKPPSLKEQALDALLRLAGCSNTFASEDTADSVIIRRALEQLPDHK